MDKQTKIQFGINIGMLALMSVMSFVFSVIKTNVETKIGVEISDAMKTPKE
mgnify:CR=1 FL=1